ncbi:MAG: radical SAM/SPASM domain-containing protein [Deltaproteobacteria bacterium]|nr:radical SAM/SPASM domain-containing protein [Deltaproteobacteria bacterium]
MTRRVFPLPDFIEVELGTYCNRSCDWCGNAWSDRGRRRRAMEPSVWNGLLADLRRHRFRGRLAFHNYNEPLADPDFDHRLIEARRALRRAKLVLYTNGDFLDAARARSLESLGLDQANVTLYPENRHAFDPPDSTKIDRFLEKIDAKRGLRTDKRTKLVHTVRIGRLRVVVRVPRIENYNDRAGSVGLVSLGRGELRSAPCLMLHQAAAIDVHGRLKLCCQIYDTEVTPSGVVGDVRTGFVAVWRSELARDLRARLASAEFSNLPCQTCHHSMAQELWDRATSRLEGPP